MNKEITELLINNKWDKCFEVLIDYFKDNDGTKKKVILLQSRFNSVSNEYSKGVIEYKQKELVVNQIRSSIIDLLSIQNPSVKNLLSESAIEIDEIFESKELVKLKFIHVHSGTTYHISFPINSHGRLLQEKLKSILIEKQNMIFEMEDGRPVTFGIFYEREGHERKRIEINKTLKEQGVKDEDLVILKIYPSI